LALNSIALIASVIFVKITAAQDLPSAFPPALPGASTLRLPGFRSLSSPSDRAVTTGGPSPTIGNIIAPGLTAAQDPAEGSVRSGLPRRLTLERVQQQSANRVASPLAYIGQLSVEAAKQHRLAVQADYFPKFGATFVNLHATDFLGQVLRFQRPPLSTLTPVSVPILNKDFTIAALSFVQPVTPLLEVRQAVRIARADERIAIAKAGASISKNARDAEVERAYFELLIAQRQLTSAEWKLKSGAAPPLYASATARPIVLFEQEPATIEARKAAVAAAARVKELTASLNRIMGWADDTELELAIPDPLIENISLQEIADKPTAVNPALVEAEQTVVKARAAFSLSRLAYVPTVAAFSGYQFQNLLPAVTSNFGYGGVVASYTLFDFGKREHTVKEARARFEMAQAALQLTKAKLASDVKQSYSELERSRQVSLVAQKVGSSTAFLMKVSTNNESLEVKAARADVELEMIEADFAHRQAFQRLNALIGPER
jgi:hypothetical protein